MGWSAKKIRALLTEKIADIVEVIILSNDFCPIEFDCREREGIVYKREGEDWVCRDWKTGKLLGKEKDDCVINDIIDALINGTWSIAIVYRNGKLTQLTGHWGPCELCDRRKNCEFWIE